MIRPREIAVKVSPSFYPGRTDVDAGITLRASANVEDELCGYHQVNTLTMAVDRTRREVWYRLYGDIYTAVRELQADLQYLSLDDARGNGLCPRIQNLENRIRELLIKLEFHNEKPESFKTTCPRENQQPAIPATFSTPRTPQEKGASQDPSTSLPIGIITTPSTGVAPEPLKAFQTVSQ